MHRDINHCNEVINAKHNVYFPFDEIASKKKSHCTFTHLCVLQLMCHSKFHLQTWKQILVSVPLSNNLLTIKGFQYCYCSLKFPM